MIEYEKKIILSETEYSILLVTMFNGVSPIVHKNYYYDTETYDMNEKLITFRIREKDGKYKPTVKYHVKNISDMSIECDYAASESLDPSVFENDKLIFQGGLICERRTINIGNSIRVTLDKNDYLKHTDHELEIEYAEKEKDLLSATIEFVADHLSKDGNKTYAHDLLCRANNAKSKSERFIERIKATKMCESFPHQKTNCIIYMKKEERIPLDSAIAVNNNANAKIKWHSSNKKTVSVTNGLMCAHQCGNAFVVSVDANDNHIAYAYLVTVMPDEACAEKDLHYKAILESLFGFSTDDPDQYIK